jgi:hypothetical protein
MVLLSSMCTLGLCEKDFRAHNAGEEQQACRKHQCQNTWTDAPHGSFFILSCKRDNNSRPNVGGIVYSTKEVVNPL